MENPHSVLLHRLATAVAADRGVANALQRILHALQTEDAAGRAAVESVCVAHAEVLVAVLTTWPRDTVRSSLAMNVVGTVTIFTKGDGAHSALAWARFRDAGMCAAFGRIIVERSTVTDAMVLAERYGKDFHHLLPPQLEGKGDVWRQVFAYHHDSASENEDTAVMCTVLYVATMQRMIRTMPVAYVAGAMPADVILALVALTQRYLRNTGIVGASLLLMSMICRNPQLGHVGTLMDGGACRLCVDVLAGLTASMHADGALSMVLYVLKSICAEANTRFRLPSDDGISAQALVYITTQLVDVGLGEALAHALDVFAPTVIPVAAAGSAPAEFGVDAMDTFMLYCGLVMFASHASPTLVTRFGAAPVTSGRTAAALLAAVLVAAVQAGIEHDIILPAMISVLRQDAAVFGDFSREMVTLAPASWLDGELVVPAPGAAAAPAPAPAPAPAQEAGAEGAGGGAAGAEAGAEAAAVPDV